jgi:fructose-bisphosphate aldolase class II
VLNAFNDFIHWYAAGNADKIKVSSLDTMSQRYSSGELDAKIK